MSGILSKDDYQAILELQKEGWLSPVNGEKLDHRLDIKHGLQLVACSDCHQFRDMFGHISRIVTERDGHGFIHATLLNGGALLLPMVSRVRGMIPADAVIIANLMGARKLKGIATIALYSHAPCGAAGMAGVDFRETIQLLKAAKDRVKHLLTGPGEEPFTVACFCHVDFGPWRPPRPNGNGGLEAGDGHVRHTYFVPRYLPQPPSPEKLEELETELATLEIP